MKIEASELPLQPGGQIYHLNLSPDELADTVILVGDPGRVDTISQRFDKVLLKRKNRELITHTGTLNGKPISVLSTGMGTDNIDIVMNELDALANIDLKTLEIKKEHKSLTLIRIGTCGALQPDIPIHSFIASAYGFGFDGLLQFYRHDNLSKDEIVNAFIEQTGWDEKLPFPYCIPANQELLDRIGHDMIQGVTASAPGFFGPQGRVLRTELMFPNLNSKIEQFNYNGLKISNMEMECSAIYGLGSIFGHKTLTCCLAIANRVTKKFSDGYHNEMNKLIDTVLERIF